MSEFIVHYDDGTEQTLVPKDLQLDPAEHWVRFGHDFEIGIIGRTKKRIVLAITGVIQTKKAVPKRSSLLKKKIEFH